MLLKQCIKISKGDKDLKNIEKDCKELNLYYIPLKYPSHYPPLDRKKVERALKCAEGIEEVIRKKLGSL